MFKKFSLATALVALGGLAVVASATASLSTATSTKQSAVVVSAQHKATVPTTHTTSSFVLSRFASTRPMTGLAPTASTHLTKAAGCSVSYGVDWSGGWRNWHAWIIVPAPCFTVKLATWACTQAALEAGQPEIVPFCYPAALVLSHIIGGHHGVWAAFYFFPPSWTGGIY